jgi:hypothetical protein
MVPEKLLSAIIKNRMIKTQKKLSGKDLSEIKKELEKYNYSQLEMVTKYNIITSLRHAAANSPLQIHLFIKIKFLY